MLPEDRVPPAQRFLMAEGLLSPASIDRARPGLPATWPATARCLWLSFAFADLELGTVFDTVFARATPDQTATAAIIHAVTQQFGKPFTTVPHGWKTICVVDFPEGVPLLVERLPLADRWYEHPWSLGLCRRENLEAIRQSGAA